MNMNMNQFKPQQMGMAQVFSQHLGLYQNKSTLNPSATSFTPTTTYSAFGQIMNQITPISELERDGNEEKVNENQHGAIHEINGVNGDRDDFINDEADAWYMIEEKSKNLKANIAHLQPSGSEQSRSVSDSHPTRSYKPPIPTHSNSKTADLSLSSQTTAAITSPSFSKRKSRYFNNHEDDTRQYNKSWRNFGNKTQRDTLPPRWRNNGYSDKTKSYSALSFRSNKTEVSPKLSYYHPKPIKLLVEFVKHVTLPNRENYPPNTVLKKTWYVVHV